MKRTEKSKANSRQKSKANCKQDKRRANGRQEKSIANDRQEKSIANDRQSEPEDCEPRQGDVRKNAMQRKAASSESHMSSRGNTS